MPELMVKENGANVGHVRVINEVRDFEDELAAVALQAMRLARYLGSDPQDAADVVQEAALQAWRYRDTRRGEFKPWFLSIVRRVAHRRHTRWTLIPFSWLPAGQDAAPESFGDSAVARAMARLPRRQRAAVWLRFGEDLAYADVSRILGVREGAAKMLVARGRTQLRRYLGSPTQERIK